MKPGIIPYQDGDIVTNGQESGLSPRPAFPQYQLTHGSFYKPHDIPLNKRHFIYSPCAPRLDFTEMGYCLTEYPFERAGFSLMDRSAGISLKDKDNSIIGVEKSVGWRTGRSDVCIKEGISYWEVEIIKGGSIMGTDNDPRRKKDMIDSSPHLRFGISRREASLEAPVGFDSYSYGIRDQYLESISEGKLSQVLEKREGMQAGDIISFVLKLPDYDAQVEQAQEYALRRKEALKNAIDSSGKTMRTDDNAGAGTIKKKSKTVKQATNEDFQLALLEDITYNDIIRDHIPIRYRNQLFFEATDYIKTTKPEYYSSDKRERQDYYTLKDSYLAVYLNGEFLGKAFENLNPFLPPFSELQYNEKFYYGYWKNYNGQHVNGLINPYKNVDSESEQRLILRNKYVNNNRLGYYPTISCFNDGEVKIITEQRQMKYLDTVKSSELLADKQIKTLDVLYKEQIADDIVWDIIDEVEEEGKKLTNTNPPIAAPIDTVLVPEGSGP
ncbi:Bre2p KNAG_0B05110 [Huiozyma naganishii CBS 8797]|uniref:SPRY domain-containing protein n=1 Tax=Huiozyma naganishii (strain ATCC MYA-139 / BCRC 22969 / CBS 8797 / KCTC 17520 / NBRC 10181 / NCYC 3082 / Yp74L-3) TaxID=1071383 RepID=J7S3W5_HUIN7|nr:hypothetical protein KNAG_0B05110 [Kazachstania naganishii CBS 8797]CCK68944.1 hypothetical protein KNAG_0B05110 [Kazachstania naganishii CBS 8797]